MPCLHSTAKVWEPRPRGGGGISRDDTLKLRLPHKADHDPLGVFVRLLPWQRGYISLLHFQEPCSGIRQSILDGTLTAVVAWI